MSVLPGQCGLSGCAPQRALAGVGMAMLLLLPAPGFCDEVTIGLDGAYVHDSNFYGTSSDEVSADSIEPGGSIAIEHDGDRLRYEGLYKGSYQAYRKDDQDEANAWEHRARLGGSYDIDPLTTVRLKNYFRDVRNQRFVRDDITSGDTGLEPNNDRYQRNDLELQLHRDLTSSWEVEANAAQQFINYDNNTNRSDSDSIGVGGRVLHRYAPQHRFGGGVSLVQQNFDGDDFRLDAEAQYLITELVWIFDINDQMQLVVNGGPAWVTTDEDPTDSVQQTQFVGGSQGGELFRANVLSCGFDDVSATGIASRCNADTPGAAPIPADNLGANQNFPLTVGPQVGENEEDVTFFGGVSLVGRFSDWIVNADLRRQQNPPSGDAIAGSLTRLRGEVDFAPPLSLWSAYLAGSVERREAFSNSTAIDYVVIPGEEDAAQRSVAFTTDQNANDSRDAFTALTGVRRQFSRNLSGDVGVSFRRTERELSGQPNNNETDTYFFVVKLVYVFDTFHI